MPSFAISKFTVLLGPRWVSAEFLLLSTGPGYNAIYDLLGSGKLKGYRNGRVWRIPKESVKQYILENARLK